MITSTFTKILIFSTVLNFIQAFIFACVFCMSATWFTFAFALISKSLTIVYTLTIMFMLFQNTTWRGSVEVEIPFKFCWGNGFLKTLATFHIVNDPPTLTSGVVSHWIGRIYCQLSSSMCNFYGARNFLP